MYRFFVVFLLAHGCLLASDAVDEATATYEKAVKDAKLEHDIKVKAATDAYAASLKKIMMESAGKGDLKLSEKALDKMKTVEKGDAISDDAKAATANGEKAKEDSPKGDKPKDQPDVKTITVKTKAEWDRLAGQKYEVKSKILNDTHIELTADMLCYVIPDPDGTWRSSRIMSPLATRDIRSYHLIPTSNLMELTSLQCARVLVVINLLWQLLQIIR